MSSVDFGAVAAFLALLGTGIGVWVSTRERMIRTETRVDTLEKQHSEHRLDFADLRHWLQGQFDSLRNEINRKADRDK